jgi:hypothetical protein
MLVYMQSAWLLLCPNHNGLLTHLLALVSPQAACTVLPTWRQQCAQNQLPAGIACLCCQAYTIPHGTWHNPASVTADCALAVSPGGSSVRTMVCPLASAASAASTIASLACPASLAGFRLEATHTKLPANCWGEMNCARPVWADTAGRGDVHDWCEVCYGDFTHALPLRNSMNTSSPV